MYCKPYTTTTTTTTPTPTSIKEIQLANYYGVVQNDGSVSVSVGSSSSGDGMKSLQKFIIYCFTILIFGVLF